MTDATKPNILQRINAVQKEFGYIQKDQKKVGGLYTAVRYDDIVEKAQPLFVKHGIIMVTEALPGWSVEDTAQKTAKGAVFTRYQGIFETTFFNCDDITDFVVSSAPGFGLDEGDKGAGKAHTYATKSNLIKTLFLVTGDNEEERAETRGAEPKKAALAGFTAAVLADYKTNIAAAKGEPEVQVELKLAKKELVKACGEYAGHPDWTAVYDAATKRIGELRESTKDA